MKNILSKISAVLLICMAGLVSCTDGLDEPRIPVADTGVVFNFSINREGVELRTRSDDDSGERMRHIWYVIADSRGRVLDLPYHKLSDDLSSLRIEGLSYGSYRCAFLATTGDARGVQLSEPSTLSELWLSLPENASVFGDEFFYGSIDIEVDKSQEAIDEDVELRRCVGAVTVSMKYPSAYMRRFVRRISLTFDEPIYAGMNAGGGYSGGNAISDLDVTDGVPVLMFPSERPLSGHVSVESVRSDGSPFTRHYRFDSCEVEAGRISHIDIDYIHPEDADGVVRVREEDYKYLPHIDTMWLADEDKTVMYNRSFNVNDPLQVSINGNRRLQIRFFSPVPVDNVTIKAQLRSVSSETFVLASFDRLFPYMDAEFDLPIVERNCVYTTERGQRIELPAQPSLSASDLTLVVDTGDDPFMQKISRIPYTWRVTFANVGYDWSVDMTPALCRHANALIINMAYMFCTEDFDEALKKYEGNIYANNGNRVIPLDEIRGRIKNLNGVNVLRCGNCVGYGGMGGAWFYWLAHYCWTGHYYDVRPSNDQADHNYSRQAIFHEFGHVLGYGHGDQMTYGDKWTVLCANEYCRQGRAGLLPVNKSTEVTSLPM